MKASIFHIHLLLLSNANFSAEKFCVEYFCENLCIIAEAKHPLPVALHMRKNLTEIRIKF